MKIFGYSVSLQSVNQASKNMKTYRYQLVTRDGQQVKQTPSLFTNCTIFSRRPVSRTSGFRICRCQLSTFSRSRRRQPNPDILLVCPIGEIGGYQCNSWPILLQKSFYNTGINLPRRRRGVRKTCGGPSLCANLTGDFGSAPEDTSTSDYRLLRLLAGNLPYGIYGLLQHYRPVGDGLSRLSCVRFQPSMKPRRPVTMPRVNFLV